MRRGGYGREREGEVRVAAILTVVLAGATAAGMVWVGHALGLAHFHLLAGIPVGAVLMGAGTATGVAFAIRLSKSYDTAGFRIFAQVGGFSAYLAAVVLDFSAHQIKIGKATAPTTIIDGLNYFRLLVDQGSKAVIAQLPQWIHVPPELALWIGIFRIVVEILGTVVATGWVISLLASVPFCWQNWRFYQLKHLVESANTAAVREWERAITQRRPIEARAILTRVRAGKVERGDKTWMRIAVHQCPVCQASRVRIEKRRRALGLVRTEPSEEMELDSAQSTALLAT